MPSVVLKLRTIPSKKKRMTNRKNRFTNRLILLFLLVMSTQLVTADSTDDAKMETFINSYFARIMAYDYAGMRAMATPTFETIDYGLRMGHPGFEDYIRNTSQIFGFKLDLKTSQFNTQISDDIAYTSFMLNYGGGDHLTTVILRRSGKEWLIDRFVQFMADNQPEAIVRQFYHHLKNNNFVGMRALAKPDFNIVIGGARLDWTGFEKRQRAIAESQHSEYRLSDFKPELSDEKIEVSFQETEYPNSKKGGSRKNSFILKRSDEKPMWGEPLWRVDQIIIGPLQTGQEAF